MPKPDAAADLAGKMILVLERRREQDGDIYPPSLAQLVAEADPQAPADLAIKALKKKPVAARLLAASKHPHSPVALAEDVDRLADSPRLLEFVLSLLCTPEKRLHPPGKLIGKVNKALQAAFGAALRRRIAAKALPPTVGVAVVRGKPQLYLQALPPLALALARELISALRECKTRGDGYPARLGDLTDAPAERRREAVAETTFKAQTACALEKNPDGPVALAEDANLLAASPLTLEAALTAVRKPDHQAVPLPDLKKKVTKPLQPAFEASVVARLAAGVLTPGVGCLYVKKKPHFFLLCDLNLPEQAPVVTRSTDSGIAVGAGSPRPTRFQGGETPPLPASEPIVPVVDFAAGFDEAFGRLDRQKGSHNLVSLVDLRQAVRVSRPTFDAGLQQLRRAGRYTLSTAEGRHGVTAEERAAGLVEEGALLLFASKKTG